jgi:hypothetical protein
MGAAFIQLQGAAYALTLVFVVAVILIMMKDIFTGEVTTDRVAGAICVYVLIGFGFAIVHMCVLLYNPEAYKDSSGDQLTYHGVVSAQKDYPLFVYYSFCALSTLGYGDMVPISRIARTMSWLEAVTGQIYLTVLVARLVGLHIAAGSSSSGSSSGNSSSFSSSSSDTSSITSLSSALINADPPKAVSPVETATAQTSEPT